LIHFYKRNSPGICPSISGTGGGIRIESGTKTMKGIETETETETDTGTKTETEIGGGLTRETGAGIKVETGTRVNEIEAGVERDTGKEGMIAETVIDKAETGAEIVVEGEIEAEVVILTTERDLADVWYHPLPHQVPYRAFLLLLLGLPWGTLHHHHWALFHHHLLVLHQEVLLHWDLFLLWDTHIFSLKYTTKSLRQLSS